MALVGRAAEQAVIAETVHRVASGSGAAVLISGEPGVGKSELGQYALDEAETEGFATVTSRAQPLDRNLAYAVAIDAFGRQLRTMPLERRSRLVAGLSPLVHLFDDLDLQAPERLDDPVLERTRMFEAVLRLLTRMTSSTPVALLVDDLHWADSASLELLAYLVRDLLHVPLLLLVTYREPPAAPDRPFMGLLHTLRRTGAARDLPVTPLRRADIGTLLTHLLGGEPARDLVDVITDRAGGAPLFVEAFTGWLRETDRLTVRNGRWTLATGAASGVPPAVKEVITAELAALPADVRAVLDLVATEGGHAESAVLAAAARRDVPGLDVAQVVTRLVQSGRLVEDVEERVRYRFSHPMWHEVAYQAIPAPRRRQLHAHLAEVHRSCGDRQHEARHIMSAGPDLQAGHAAESLVAAGDRALDRYATEDARTFFTEALARAEQSGESRVTDAMIGLGEALRRSGLLGEAARTWRFALVRNPDLGGPHERARLYRLIADVESVRGDLAASDTDVEAGLAELAAGDPCEEHLELLTVLLTSRQRDADLDGARRVLDRIEDFAPQVASTSANLRLTAARIGVLLEQGDYLGAVEVLTALSAAQVAGDHRLQTRNAQITALIAAVMGDLAALREANAKVDAYERDLGIAGWTYRGALYRFDEAFYAGDWDRAADAFDAFSPASPASPVDDPRVLVIAFLVKAMLAAYRADFDEAQRLLDNGRARVEAGHMPLASGRALLNMFSGIVALERQDPLTALDFLDRNNGYFVPAVLPPWGLVALAEAQARTGRGEAAEKSIRTLTGYGTARSYPGVMRLRLRGLLHAGTDHGSRLCLRARDGFVALGMPFEAARSIIESGESLTESGASLPDSVVEGLTTAYRTTSRIGAARYAGRAGRLLRAAGVALPRSESTRETVLTSRQLEIAELVAEGLHNAEIGERLCISVRTVTSHLDHIYTKLGIRSRAALASHVAEHARADRTNARLRTSADAAGTPTRLP